MTTQAKAQVLIPLKVLLAAGVVCAIGVFFRLYPLQQDLIFEFFTGRNVAEQLVRQNLKAQMLQGANVRYPELDAASKQKWAEQQTRIVIKSEKGQFDTAVSAMIKNLKTTRRQPSGRTYLLGADSYYFLYLTRNILETGQVGPAIKNGKYFNPLRQAPVGTWSVFYLHPYVGAYFYQALRLLNPNIDLMETLNYVPILLSVLAGLAFLFACRSLNIDLFGYVIGGIILLLAPAFMHRSSLGWYDSDPYNCVFPLVILALAFWSFQVKQRSLLGGALAAVATIGYAFFWAGWPLFFILIMAASVASGIVTHLRFKGEANPFTGFLISYVGVSVIAALLVIGPARVIEIFGHGLEALHKFDAGEVSIWPNIFLTVGETKSISPKKLIFLTSNYVAVTLSCLGIVFMIHRLIKSRTAPACGHLITLLLITAAVTVLALRTERFSILCVPPFSLLAACAASRIAALIESRLARIDYYQIPVFLVRPLLLIAISVIALPLSFASAAVVSYGMAPIMNDTWYTSLEQIEQKTPDDAVVNSWWPPGHFITSISNRRVTVDGANQDRPESYWLARALLTGDEAESASILRMVNVSGNDAVEFLLERDIPLEKTVAAVNEVLRPDSAAVGGAVLDSLSERDRTEFVTLVQGSQAPPPTYLLLYDDLMTQNLAMTVLAKWDFTKAADIRAQARESGGVLAGTKKYLDELASISGKFLRYSPEAGVQKRIGNQLAFSNGLRVDLEAREAILELPDKGLAGNPMSFFFLEGNQLTEKIYDGNRIDVSALLIQREDEFASVVADRDLIRSMLFRLFYLDGQGLELFRQVIKEQDSNNGTKIFVYQVNWDALELLAA